MKPSIHRFFPIFLGSLLATSLSHAQTSYYWDENDNTGGFGIASGTWAVPTLGRWSTSILGSATPASNLTTTHAHHVNFGGDLHALGAGTITVDGTVQVRDITYGNTTSGMILNGGTINLAPASTISTNFHSHTHTIHSSLIGAGTAMTKTGAGTLLLTGLIGYQGQTIINSGTLAITGNHTGTGDITLNHGTLNLGNDTDSGSLASSTLNLNGGTFRLTRTDGVTHSFGVTNIKSGGLVVNSGNTLNLGHVTRPSGGTFNFAFTSGILAADTTSNVGGIMPSLLRGPSWAVANGPGVNISALSSYTLTSVTGVDAASYEGANIDVDSSVGPLSAGITANSLRFSAPTGNTLSLTGANIITTGGILVNDVTGGNQATITGGTLAGTANHELHVIQGSSTGNLNIASNITNNGGQTAVYKSGAGPLTLSGNNSFTGGVVINQGELALGSAGAMNSAAGLHNALTFTTTNVGTFSLKGNNSTIRSLAGTTATYAQNSQIIQNGAATPASLTVGNSLNLDSTFEGLIQDGTGGGALALVKTGTGKLTLNNSASSYTGGTFLHQGTLIAAKGGVLGANATTLTFTGDSTLQSGHTSSASNPTDLSQNIVINHNVTARLNTINQFHKLWISGAVGGTGTLWIAASDNGNGEVRLRSTSNNHTGPIRIGEGGQDGNLIAMSIADGPGAIEFGGTTGSGFLTFEGTGASNYANRTVTLSGSTGGADIKNHRVRLANIITFQRNLAITGVGNKTLTLGGWNTGNNAFNGIIPDGVGSIISFEKAGTGKWILNNTANTYTGPSSVNEGILEVKKLADGGLPSSIGQSLSHPDNLKFGLAASTLRYTGGGDSTDRNFTMLGNLTLDSSGSGAMAFDQTGIISPDITGLVGTFITGNARVNGLADTSNLVVGMTVTSGAFNGTKTISAINSSSSINLNNGSGIVAGSFGISVGTATPRTLTLGGTNTGANTLAGILQDSSAVGSSVVSVVKVGNGTWILSGNSTFSGATTVSAGTLEVTSLADGGEPSPIGQSSNDAANLILANGGTLRYGGSGHSTDRSFRINGTSAGHQATLNASGTGPVHFTNTASPAYNTNNQTRTLNLRGTNTDANTLSANLVNNGSGAVTVVKHDAGTWVLAGENHYTGATTINAGTLRVDGSLAPGSTVAVNGTSTLGGNGTIGGSVSVQAGANLDPGDLSIGGNLTISAMAGGAGKIHYDLGSADARDKITVTGTLSIGTGVLGLDDLEITQTGGVQNGTYTLIEGTTAINGTLDAANSSAPIGNGGTATLLVSASGTNLELAISGLVVGGTFDSWAPSSDFSGDANNDGLSNGLAFLLGAGHPDVPASGLLPVVTEDNGGLALTFRARKLEHRGTAVLMVEYSSDLADPEAWTEVVVPEANYDPNPGISFTVVENPENPELNDVTVTIPNTEATQGRLFVRLKATE